MSHLEIATPCEGKKKEHEILTLKLLIDKKTKETVEKIKTGVSFTYDDYTEFADTASYDRTENSVGAFFEYAYDNLEALSLTAGLRIDNHNKMGFFVTPRLHVKYTPWEKSAFRFSVGRGKRTANIFAENMSLFATSRQIIVEEDGGEIYGMDSFSASSLLRLAKPVNLVL